jgi:hypothetical protein
VRKERGKRGAAAKQREQELALRAMDLRFGQARDAVAQAYALSQAMCAALQPGKHAGGSPADMAKFGARGVQLEADLAKAQAVLGGEWVPERVESSFIESESSWGSPEPR